MTRIILPLICAALGLAAASCSQSEAPFAPAESPAPSSRGTAAAAMASPSSGEPAGGGLERRDAAAGVAPRDGAGQSQPAQTAGSTAPVAPQPAAKSPDVLEPSPSDTAALAPQSAPQTGRDSTLSAPAQRRASTLIGMSVVSRDGSPLGAVKDIIFDRQGQATHVVVAHGGEPPIGPPEAPDTANPESSPDGKLTAMPWDAAMASIKDGRLVLDGAKLQEAPSFKPGEWPNLDDQGWSNTADDYWRKVVRANVAAHPGAPIDSTTRQRGRRTRDGE